MNVHETRFGRPDPDQGIDQLVIDRDSSFVERGAAVAATAGAEAEDVDRKGRFPKAAIDAAREQK